MNPQTTSLRLFHESLERAGRSPEFLDRFYYRFIGSDDRIAAMFKGRDMGRIKAKLRTTLELATDTADHKPGLGMYLELLGRIHERIQVTPEQLALWEDALIATAAECDPRFDEATRTAWRVVLDGVLAKMQEAAAAA